PYGDQGLLISRALYDAVDGYPDQPLMEDVAIARRLGRGGIALLPLAATTSAARYRREGWLRRGLRNWTCLALYFAGVSPERIAARYRGGGGR
ncbi:MAG: glycosyl transferase family 2, partial [Pseudomonadota bacterium]